MSYDDDAESAPDLVFDRPTLRPPKESGGMWELVNDWSLFYKGDIYHIPAGFKTDGASIPRFLWRVCGTPLDVPRIYAAIVHDWLYSGGDVEATRAEADAIYRDLQIALGVSRFKAYTEWGALRLCGGSHWYGNKKEGSSKMNRLILFAAFAAVAGFTGCKSMKVERHPATLATITQTNGVVTAALDANGKPITLDGGWEVSYFQHWTWTRLDTLAASAGPGVSLSLNGYESGADSNLVALVKVSFDGAALLAAKVGAAIATSGGSVAADAAKEGISALVKKFIAKGGDATKATVSCSGGSCTVTDGTITESCTDCFR